MSDIGWWVDQGPGVGKIRSGTRKLGEEVAVKSPGLDTWVKVFVLQGLPETWITQEELNK